MQQSDHQEQVSGISSATQKPFFVRRDESEAFAHSKVCDTNPPMQNGHDMMIEETDETKKHPEGTERTLSIQFLQEAYELFRAHPTDKENILWAIDFCRRSIISTDLMLQQMVNEMVNTIQNLVQGIASHVVEARCKKVLGLLDQLRQDEMTNMELERALGATHDMSHELLEKIRSIISTTDNVPPEARQHLKNTGPTTLTPSYTDSANNTKLEAVPPSPHKLTTTL